MVLITSLQHNTRDGSNVPGCDAVLFDDIEGFCCLHIQCSSKLLAHWRWSVHRFSRCQTPLNEGPSVKFRKAWIIKPNALSVLIYTLMFYIYIYIYIGCPRRNVPDFGRVFLMLKYTDITQNTYFQSWTVTEIMAREKCGLLAGLRTVPCQLTAFRMSVLGCRVRLHKHRWRSYVSTPLWLTMYSAWNP